jgi:hypothetical protein
MKYFQYLQTMNRLVIIGNGFDLSCKLNTGYKDFLVFYFNNCLRSINNFQGPKYSDPLIDINDNFGIHSLDINQLRELSEIFNHKNIKHNLYSELEPSEKNLIELKIKSKLVKRSLLEQEYNWAGIESTYYDLLLEIVEEDEKNNQIKSIRSLNKEFEYFKKIFIQYIINEEKRTDESFIKKNRKSKFIHKCFSRMEIEDYRAVIGKDEFWSAEEQALNKIVFLNFNYTSLLEKQILHYQQNYVRNELKYPEFNTKFEIENREGYIMSDKSYQVINIHGDVKNGEIDINDIIFGFGDDTSDGYKKLENSNIDDFLFQMKQFFYPTNNKYHVLMNFLKNDKYDVFIAGHSLGISDRVLLKTIFEHENCKLIRLFHRGGKRNQFLKRIAVSRHIEDKKAMREKFPVYNEKDIID